MSPNQISAEPLILAVAPNGARLQKAAHATVPIGAEELASEAKACAEVGATLFHLHVRGSDGTHSLDAGRYRDAIEAIESACLDLVIQVTTEAVGLYRPDQQINLIRDLKPKSFSIALRELIPDPSHQPAARSFLSWVRDEGIHAQHILYSVEDVARFQDLLHLGVICDHHLLPLLVCGRHVDQIDSIGAYEKFAAEAYEFRSMYCGFGPAENSVAERAIASGAHCRIGFENNLYNRDGSVAQTNAERIEEIAAFATAQGRPLATIDDTRRVLGLRD